MTVQPGERYTFFLPYMIQRSNGLAQDTYCALSEERDTILTRLPIFYQERSSQKALLLPPRHRMGNERARASRQELCSASNASQIWQTSAVRVLDSARSTMMMAIFRSSSCSRSIWQHNTRQAGGAGGVLQPGLSWEGSWLGSPNTRLRCSRDSAQAPRHDVAIVRLRTF